MKKGIHPDTLLWNFNAQKLQTTPSRDLEASCLQTSLSNSLLQEDQGIAPLKFRKRLFSLYNACLAKSSIQHEGKIKAFLEMQGLNICILCPSSEKFPWGWMYANWTRPKKKEFKKEKVEKLMNSVLNLQMPVTWGPKTSTLCRSERIFLDENKNSWGEYGQEQSGFSIPNVWLIVWVYLIA